MNDSDDLGTGQTGDAEARGEPRKARQSERLLTLAQEAAVELWATPAGEPYMTVPVRGYVEHHPLSGRTGRARDWLAKRYYEAEGGPPSAQPLQDALGVLRARASWDGERHEAHVRYAATDECTYLDLADAERRVVKIAPDGWSVIESPPVRFVRPDGILALPAPLGGGRLDLLRELLNVEDDDGWTLICGWLVGTMAPEGPYPLLDLSGEQGSAKSTAARLLLCVTDPNKLPLRSPPRTERDLMISAQNARVLTFDNVSRLPDWLSDTLCRVATGGGIATRKLYTDADVVILDATRPVILTGIGEVAVRGDLIDRTSMVTLKPIPAAQRKTESELDTYWREIHPLVLGALLDATATALSRLPQTRPDGLPRLADHARFVTAAEPSLGWESGTYLRVYGSSRARAFVAALDASAIAGHLRAIAEKGFDGTFTELHTLITQRIDDPSESRRLPANAQVLSAELRRLAPSLRESEIKIEFQDAERPKRVVLRMSGHSRDGRDGGSRTDAPDASLHNASNGSSGEIVWPSGKVETW
jgi:hypothetical protein